jgi:hypothetical protein
MNTFTKLSLFLTTLYSAAIFANFQDQNPENSKYYLKFEMLDFSEHGIYLHRNHGQALHLQQIQFDGNGYFISGFLDSLFPASKIIAKCNYCGFEYHNSSPQPCKRCDKSEGFEIIYVDDGYGT